MEKQIETGIFSGSFNPIHMGHLMLAGYISAFTYVKEVWFVVTPHNPLKLKESLLSDDIRLEMVRLALEDYDNLKVSDVEFHMPRPSYTIDTLNTLSQKYPDRRFSLIIGGDNWSLFNKWKDYEQILERYQILIYPRPGEKIRISKRLRKSVQLVNAPEVEISSTFIRHAIGEGKEMRAFLPPKVYDYIKNNRLYRKND
ncbi:MAG: nicotinate-nucleotide adenylyltransferase [Porphyromonadaceae bacterium]|nr:nicotinate-nucleotide adenylyltransferase [Porphyromonadaceae bacterium]